MRSHLLNAEKIRQKEELVKMKARTQILDEIKKNDYLVDAKVDVDKDGMKLLIKKVHEKDIPIVLKEK